MRLNFDSVLNSGIRPFLGRQAIFALVAILAAVSPANCPAQGSRTPAANSDADGDEKHPLLRVMEFADESREALKEVKDYTAVFTKRELVKNRMVKQVMDVKLREKPFSVYFKFRSGDEAGREVIYVAGANNGRLRVHEVGIKAIVGTLDLRPDDPRVMAESRHPITRVGMANLLETNYKIWDAERKVDPATVDVKLFPDAKLADKTPCQALQITHAQPNRDVKFHISRIYFHKETKLPIRVENYDWPRRSGEKPPLIEEYEYSNIKTNVGLKDIDFDTRNRQYGF
ncbi:MAG: DUF1571 domain-containing protein [Planctomycetaceae bacterium]|nr:DUF1571 domain-containing protein [Planctomycetaceae bacterium]